MILSDLRIDSFAGLSGRSFRFDPGLNIVSGPNEAGKSTMFNALLHTLFTPANPGKRRFRDELAGFLPLAGGDTISCTVILDAGGHYTLHRAWGAAADESLELPGGGRVSDADGIAETLRSLLPVTEGTMKSIFLVYQNSLAYTLDELQDSPETEEELGGVIRKSLFETAGLSVERFRKLLEERYNEYFSRWDIDGNRPEGSRGIENPWVKGVGRIVEAWYAWKSLEGELERTRRVEAEREALAEEHADTGKSLTEIRGYLEEYRVAYTAMKKMESLSLRYERACAQRDKHREAIEAWTRKETEIASFRRESERLAGELERLKKERTAAEQAEESEKLEGRLRELRTLKIDLDAAEEELNATPRVDGTMVEELRALERDVARLEDRLSAGELRLRILGKAEVDLRLVTGAGEARDIHLLPGVEESVQIGGYGEVDAGLFTLTVSEGELDPDALRKELDGQVVRRKELLAACGVDSVERAEEAALKRSALKSRLEQARAAFARTLGDDDYEDLRQRGAETAGERTRPLHAIIEDIAVAGQSRKNAEENLQRLEEDLSELGSTYENRDGATAAFSAAAVEAEKIRQDMEGCGEIPPGFPDAGAFVRDYDEKEERRRRLEEEWYGFRQRMLELEKNLPDESEEELAGRCADAREEFEGALRTGRYLAVIKTRTEEILESLDRDTFSVYGRACEHYMNKLTSGAYTGVSLDGGLPSGVRGAGPEVPHSLLSAGTADSLALAVRLAAADTFLNDRQGFLVLDDPLVDMDPERRKNAAALIDEWATKHQVIFFTCHPEHVTLFTSPRVIHVERPV